jgi:hypothetical protein
VGSCQVRKDVARLPDTSLAEKTWCGQKGHEGMIPLWERIAIRDGMKAPSCPWARHAGTSRQPEPATGFVSPVQAAGTGAQCRDARLAGGTEGGEIALRRERSGVSLKEA